MAKKRVENLDSVESVSITKAANGYHLQAYDERGEVVSERVAVMFSDLVAQLRELLQEGK